MPRLLPPAMSPFAHPELARTGRPDGSRRLGCTRAAGSSRPALHRGGTRASERIPRLPGLPRSSRAVGLGLRSRNAALRSGNIAVRPGRGIRESRTDERRGDRRDHHGLRAADRGIIAGAVALAQIKRTGEKGRGLAIGGIIAGGVITVLTILATVAFVLFAILGAGVAASSADPFDLPAEPGDGGVTIGPSEQAPGDLYTLAVGACLDDIPSGFISPSNLVDCAQPHTYEVFGSFFLDDGAFPGDDAIESSAYEGCDAAYPDYVGVTWDQSALAYSFVSPSEETWAEGDREISCLLYDPAVDQTTGSLRGAAR